MSIHRKLASGTGETGRKHRAEGENAVKTRADATRRDDSKRARSMRLDNPAFVAFEGESRLSKVASPSQVSGRRARFISRSQLCRERRKHFASYHLYVKIKLNIEEIERYFDRSVEMIRGVARVCCALGKEIQYIDAPLSEKNVSYDNYNFTAV